MNIDERLEEITKDNVQYLAPTQALAQALLRARQALELWRASAYECKAATCRCGSRIHLKQLNADMVEQTRAALADTELSKSLGAADD